MPDLTSTPQSSGSSVIISKSIVHIGLKVDVEFEEKNFSLPLIHGPLILYGGRLLLCLHKFSLPLGVNLDDFFIIFLVLEEILPGFLEP